MHEPVHLTGICHRYGRLPSLNGINLEFHPGTVTALVGGNGSGKSTLLGLLAGTLRPTSGVISGVPTNTALVPQHSTVPDLFPVTVRRTVSMGRWRARGLMRSLSRSDRGIVDQAMSCMGIADLADRTLGDLSGGQRQRTFIAQGLAQQADLLLLDEPLAAVDSTTVLMIDQAIRAEKASGTTVVIATHHWEQANTADQVIVLDRGQLATTTLTEQQELA
ncbi:zinc ABC transporter ATP-binding protein AztA [Corynebacterium alimapuense]|uniref:ABC transporter ATP-binding protein n=1 Tax=Corynebacterium alimapuense TaxID=1576874 RepID=A0A3M8K658_9CORY|nr:zinc ABC transporter ATP-binding protein AztA [Corynebacterium alimapuense]RNE48235.1 ABC transporter ATP-binding protein [Corynebacterium alimapuense]